MKIPKSNRYYCIENGSLLINVLKVWHYDIDRDYIRIKLSLCNKKKWPFEESKNYEIKLSMIQHWRECEK